MNIKTAIITIKKYIIVSEFSEVIAIARFLDKEYLLPRIS